MLPRHVAQLSKLRITLALIVCVSLLLVPSIPTLVSGAAQGQGDGRAGRPRPGKPEGTLPNLDEVKNESQSEREAPPPIPSSLRSKKNAGKPWDGRRVGDPIPQNEVGQTVEQSTKTIDAGRAGDPKAMTQARNHARRAHARRRATLPPPPVLDNQFVQNFFTWAVVRNPTSAETTYWYDQMRVAYGQGQESLKLAAIECGRTLFESAEYAARNRDAHWYVYDLYKSYLMRDPDAGGWAYWEAFVPTHGREYVRRGFEESTEFATLIANIVPNGSATAAASSLISAQVDPRSQPGRGMLTRDASWSAPLLSLPGRSGLDLGLALSYSSQIWTRSGPYIYFDEDNAFPQSRISAGLSHRATQSLRCTNGQECVFADHRCRSASGTAPGRRFEYL